MNTRTDNAQSEKEKAEGSTENVNVNPGQPDPGVTGGEASEPMERGAGQISQPDRPIPPAAPEKRERGQRK